MLGLDPGVIPLTSFWTDQYGIRIQYLGQARLADAVTFDGNPEGRDFSAIFTRTGTPVGALLVGRPGRMSCCSTPEACPSTAIRILEPDCLSRCTRRAAKGLPG